MKPQTKTKQSNIFKIVAPKVKLNTKGYINLISRNRAEISRKKVKIYKTKVSFTIAKTLRLAKEKAMNLYNKAFMNAMLLGANVLKAANELKEAKRNYILSSAEYFAYYVAILKAKKRENEFKFSLPKNLRFKLY